MDLIIIAAGENSRMNGIDKGNVLINGKSNIENTVELALQNVDMVHIICNSKNYQEYGRIFLDYSKVRVYQIDSGLGDGHAILTALDKVDYNGQDLMICWCDVYFKDDKIFNELKQIQVTYRNPMIIPVIEEKDPYVWFMCDGKLLVNCAMFSKHGELTPKGYHDQSIFLIKADAIYSYLTEMHSVLLRNGKYQTGELNFLNICHLLFNSGCPAKLHVTNNKTYPYNTLEQLKQIRNEIGDN